MDKSSQALADSSSKPLQKIDNEIYRLGSIVINSERREVTIPGKINLSKGMIELIACAPGGKVHESIIVLDVVPYHLQVAMLLLGLKYGGGPQFQGDPQEPRGDSVQITVTWKNQNGDTTVPVEDLVWEVAHARTMERTPFIFVGSKMNDGQFMADQEKSLITTYHDPFTIFDNPLPGGANDDLYKVNEQLVPSKGTPITLTIKALN